MQFQVAGLFVFVAGLACLFLPARNALVLLMAFTVLGAAGTVMLPGGASIPPANFFLAFFALRVIIMRGAFPAMAGALRIGRPGFFLLLFTLFALFSAFFFPRLLAGSTEVYSLDRALAASGETVLLRPSSGNFTQSFYLVGGVATFFLAYAAARLPGAATTFLKALVLIAVLDIGFAVLDVATYYTGTSALLSVIRSGGYAILSEQTFGALKRINGSFPEPSALATYTFPLFLAIEHLFRNGYRAHLTGLLAVALMGLLVLSTSSTAYASIAFYIVLSFWRTLNDSMRRGFDLWSIFKICALGGLSCLVIGLFAVGAMPEFVGSTVDSLLFQKLDSDSGVTRSSWNTQAVTNFFETDGLGIGLGSSRASSFAFVLLSNLGLFGTILFLCFLGRIFLTPTFARTGEFRLAIGAAKQMLLGTLVAACIVMATFDLGILFYLSAGVLASLQALQAVPSPRTARRPAVPMRNVRSLA